MNPQLKTFISRSSSAALLIAGACGGFYFGSPLIGSIVGGILTNIASKKLEKAELHIMRKILQGTNPSELNHDLEGLIQEALVWTTKNISYLYKSYCFTEAQKNQLEKLTKSIIDEIKSAEKSNWIASDDMLNQINDLADAELLIDSFILLNKDWPVISEERPFVSFFSEEFLNNFRICFGELLKDKKHESALLAYNRNISNQIQKNLSLNQSKLEELAKSNREIKNVLSKLSASSRSGRFEKKYVRPQTSIELNKYLETLHDKVDLLVDVNGKVLTEVREIRKESRIHTQQLGELGRKVENNIRNKMIYTIILPLLAMSVAYLSYRYWQSNQPFVFTVDLKNSSENNFLPPETASITLNYGDKSETRISANGEAVFKGLPHYLRDEPLQIEVSSFGFYPIDTLVEGKNFLSIGLIRDETFRFLKGRVLEAETARPIAGAKVMSLGIETLTDELGRFTLDIPEVQQKVEQQLFVEKENYLSWQRLEPVIKNAESTIMLEKSN